MKSGLFLLFFVVLAGCMAGVETSCDDINPCTFDELDGGQCVHRPLTGPMEGCSASGECLEYGCFSGECILQRKSSCCGNGACDPSETYRGCPMDCKATCFDGIANQGETGVDCGGPCSPCERQDINFLRKLGVLRGAWRDSSINYSIALKEYGLSRNRTTLLSSSLKAYGEAERERIQLFRGEPAKRYGNLSRALNATLSDHMLATHNMAMYASTQADRYRIESNRLNAMASDLDEAFVREYNREVDLANQVEISCYNGILDQGEESVDCGGACMADCEVTYNITKRVTVRVEGGPAAITMNVTSPAMDYPPQQRIIASYFSPEPGRVIVTAEGGADYEYTFGMSAYAVKEFTITQTVRLRRAPAPAKSASQYFDPSYLIGNNYSQTSPQICSSAKDIRAASNTVGQYTEKVAAWMAENIKYEGNAEEYGAEYCYSNRRGACDEHADLFVSMARCVGVPARRVTGALVNGSQVNGHAWAEYYDGGWVFVDPSVKDNRQAFISDNRHITACVGEGAYSCGVWYAYTYTHKMPRIEINETVYTS
jgi:hypothetical protein